MKYSNIKDIIEEKVYSYSKLDKAIDLNELKISGNLYATLKSSIFC